MSDFCGGMNVTKTLTCSVLGTPNQSQAKYSCDGGEISRDLLSGVASAMGCCNSLARRLEPRWMKSMSMMWASSFSMSYVRRYPRVWKSNFVFASSLWCDSSYNILARRGDKPVLHLLREWGHCHWFEPWHRSWEWPVHNWVCDLSKQPDLFRLADRS